MSAIPDLKILPDLPLDEEGAVFNSPWEAKVFSLIVSLHQQGHFAWTEWAEVISDEIEKDKGTQSQTCVEHHNENASNVCSQMKSPRESSTMKSQ